MTSDWLPGQISSGPNAGRILDTARGILIGVRRCSSETAFDELLTAAQRHRVPVFAMAWALVRLAGAGATPSHTFVDAQSAARYEWGRFFGQPALSTC
ncbi:MAG: ANTAR domain-containing protein [Mycobacterium sp.]